MPPILDIQAEVSRLADECAPSGGYGSVYDLWQQAYDRNLRSALFCYPEEQADKIEQELIRKGILMEEDAEMYERDDATCIHFLDAQTCPMGCFE